MTSYALGAGSSHVPVPANLITLDLEENINQSICQFTVERSYPILGSQQKWFMSCMHSDHVNLRLQRKIKNERDRAESWRVTFIE